MGTHHQGSRDEVLALDAYIKLMRAANSVTHEISAALTEFKLSPSQFGVLESLYHLGDLQQHSLGDKLLKSGGNITTVVDNLEKRGLILRERCKDDRRCIWVKLTDKGRELIIVVYPKIAALITMDMNVLSSEELGEFAELCKRVGLNSRNNK
jgi:MarR family 2-MHQ and catechol resistance regulon transcriptional repressor